MTVPKTIVHMDGRERTWLISIPNVLNQDEYTALKEHLKALEYRKGFTNSGNEVPREQLWFHRDNAYFCDSWVARYPRWDAHPYTDIIQEIQDKVQRVINEQLKGPPIPQINSCLVNYYCNGESCIQPHRDNKQSFGERPTIVGLSIGAQRRLLLHHNDKVTHYEMQLEDNSLFIMAGGSQINFMHEVPREPALTEERWSLTFREHRGSCAPPYPPS
jgi:alkylated DNA repair dioxygenase AlkB